MREKRKIFVSYKHGDWDVKSLIPNNEGTTKDYEDYLVQNLYNAEIYKRERSENFNEFCDETIASTLREKIYDSSITIVLVSPNMKDPTKLETEQWIPWEISYSLKETSYNDKICHSCGILAIVLPDFHGKYSYYVKSFHGNFSYYTKNYQDNDHCEIRSYDTDIIFSILQDNMFNYKKNNSKISQSQHEDYSSEISTDQYSYIENVKWQDFIEDTELYIRRALERSKNKAKYNILYELK